MKYVVATAAFGLALGFVFKYVGGGEPLGGAMLFTLVALPLMGFLATIDDDLPGGFSNSGGNVRGPWREWENWVDLAARGAISGLGFAIDNGWNTPAAVVPWVVGATGVVASMLVHQRIAKNIGAKV
jgi:hypothetical protein